MSETPQDSEDTFQFHSESETQTDRFGRALGRSLVARTVIALIGDLGAGKTRLVQAIAEEMGIDRSDVTSPTFILIQEYEGRLPLYHFDAYRLRDIDEFLELGADELIASDGVCLIEWADRVADALPRDLLRVEIEIVGKTLRDFQLTAAGPKSTGVIARLREELRGIAT